MVLTPWRPSETRAVFDAHAVHTVGRLSDLAELASRDGRPRVVLERLTSMRRHGFSAHDLREAARSLEGVAVEGVAFHLPISRGSHLAEMDRLMTDVVSAGPPANRGYASPLPHTEQGAPRPADP